MTEIVSANTTKERTLRNFLIPSVAEAFLYLLLGFVVLIILKQNVIYNAILRGSLVSSQDIVLNNTAATALYHVTDALGFLSTFMVWVFIGSFCYTAAWVFRNTIHSINTDVEDSRAPTIDPAKNPYWRSQTAKYIAVPVVIAAIISYLFFAVKTTRALVLNGSGGFYLMAHQNIIAWTLFSVLFLALILYGLNLLLHTLVYVFKLLNVGD